MGCIALILLICWSNLWAFSKSTISPCRCLVALFLHYRDSLIIPALRDPAWAFLGYDVSDKWLLSGLSDCGTNETEIQILSQTYASDLNEHHLFDAIKPAVDFMHVSDERVREHAPFFVFGIWLIKKEEGLAHPD